MKETILQKNYRHETFGGCIYASDFETEFHGKDKTCSTIADRIFTDWNFDKRCMKNIQNRK